MKFELLAVIGAALAAFYLVRGNTSGDVTPEIQPVASSPEIVYVPQYVPVYSGSPVIPYYPQEVYQTQIPVIPSEPGVSEGVPTGSNIPLCPVMTNTQEGTQLICQCPRGNIQGGNPVSMNALMFGTDAASVAWRTAFCM